MNSTVDYYFPMSFELQNKKKYDFECKDMTLPVPPNPTPKFPILSTYQTLDRVIPLPLSSSLMSGHQCFLGVFLHRQAGPPPGARVDAYPEHAHYAEP
jgi:hypothetical protein